MSSWGNPILNHHNLRTDWHSVYAKTQNLATEDTDDEALSSQQSAVRQNVFTAKGAKEVLPRINADERGSKPGDSTKTNISPQITLITLIYADQKFNRSILNM